MSVAAAARFGDRALFLAAVRGGWLGLGVRGRKLLGRRFGGNVFSRRSLRGRGRFLPIYCNQRDLGSHVNRSPLGHKELLYLSGKRRGELGVDLVGVHLG